MTDLYTRINRAIGTLCSGNVEKSRGWIFSREDVGWTHSILLMLVPSVFRRPEFLPNSNFLGVLDAKGQQPEYLTKLSFYLKTDDQLKWTEGDQSKVFVGWLEFLPFNFPSCSRWADPILMFINAGRTSTIGLPPPPVSHKDERRSLQALPGQAIWKETAGKTDQWTISIQSRSSWAESSEIFVESLEFFFLNRASVEGKFFLVQLFLEIHWQLLNVWLPSK